MFRLDALAILMQGGILTLRMARTSSRNVGRYVPSEIEEKGTLYNFHRQQIRLRNVLTFSTITNISYTHNAL